MSAWSLNWFLLYVHGPAVTWDYERGHHALQKFDDAVEGGVVAAILDDLTGMRDRGAITGEERSDIAELVAADDVGQVHRDLAGESNALAAARWPVEVDVPDAEYLCHGAFDEVARPAAVFVQRARRLNAYAVERSPARRHRRCICGHERILSNVHPNERPPSPGRSKYTRPGATCLPKLVDQ